MQLSVPTPRSEITEKQIRKRNGSKQPYNSSVYYIDVLKMLASSRKLKFKIVVRGIPNRIAR